MGMLLVRMLSVVEAFTALLLPAPALTLSGKLPIPLPFALPLPFPLPLTCPLQPAACRAASALASIGTDCVMFFSSVYINLMTKQCCIAGLLAVVLMATSVPDSIPREYLVRMLSVCLGKHSSASRH